MRQYHQDEGLFYMYVSQAFPVSILKIGSKYVLS